jgi:hypothetical protein
MILRVDFLEISMLNDICLPFFALFISRGSFAMFRRLKVGKERISLSPYYATQFKGMNLHATNQVLLNFSKAGEGYDFNAENRSGIVNIVRSMVSQTNP